VENAGAELYLVVWRNGSAGWSWSGGRRGRSETALYWSQVQGQTVTPELQQREGCRNGAQRWIWTNQVEGQANRHRSRQDRSAGDEQGAAAAEPLVHGGGLWGLVSPYKIA